MAITHATIKAALQKLFAVADWNAPHVGTATPEQHANEAHNPDMAEKPVYDAHDHSAADPTQVSHADLTNVSADQHHAQAHNHPASQITPGQFADGNYTFKVAAGNEGVKLKSEAGTEVVLLQAAGVGQYGRIVLDANNGGAYEVDIRSSGDSFFNGGNVAFGALSPSKVVVSDASKNLASGTNTNAEIAGAVTHAADNTQAHSDYLLNTGDVASGDYTFTGDVSFSGKTNIRLSFGTTQEVNIAGFVKLNFDAVNWDALGEWNAANKWFICTKAGYYHIGMNIIFLETVANRRGIVAIFLNGIELAERRTTVATNDYWHAGMDDIVGLAVGDKIELYVEHNIVSPATVGGTAYIYKYA